MQTGSTEWFHFSTGQFGYPQPENNFGYYDITYEMKHGCPTCHIGITQKDEFRFKSEPKAMDSQFLGLNWVFDQIFIRKPVQEIFRKENVTGVHYSTPLQNKTGKPLVSIQQIHVDTILKDALITENLTIEKCEYPKDKSQIKFLKAMDSSLIKGPFCGQTKYNYPQGISFKLKKEALANMPDFIRLNEWFGSGGSSSQPIFVSKKVKDIIDILKWRGAFLNQVELV
jgi:hypothetical protein